MPEGPEIRRAADSIAKVLEGRLALTVRFAFPHLQAFQDRLDGARVVRVETRGKAMLLHFDVGLAIYSHNQLYGRWVVRKTDQPPKTNRQIRLCVSTERGTAWLLSASDIDVLDEEGQRDHPYLSKLGPDPLAPETTAGDLVSFWGQARFARRSVAGLFLDQAFLAGVGNYLRSEILFFAGLNPRARLPAERGALAGAAIDLFRRSRRTGGITNDEELVRELKAQGVRRQQYRHWVFYREGKPCHRCGSRILKETLTGRRLYWCPGCQCP